MTDIPQPSPGGGWKGRIRQVAKDRLPEGSRKRAAATAGLSSYREVYEAARRVRAAWAQSGIREPKTPTYAAWNRHHVATSDQLRDQKIWSESASHPSAVHVIILPGEGSATRSKNSVEAQSWTHVTASVTASLAEAHQLAEHTAAELVVFLNAGDTLEPACSYEVTSAFRRDPRLDLISWDDQLSGLTHPEDPRFKPAWSPEMLLGSNYIGTSFAVRRQALQAAGGLTGENRPDEFTAAGVIWDLLLRLSPEAKRTEHIARVLGTLNARPDTAAHEAVRVVQRHLERNSFPATAESSPLGITRVAWDRAEAPHVSIVIPTRHNRKMLAKCLPSLAATDYPSFDVVIVDNGGQSQDNEDWYAANGAGLDLQVTWWTEQPFNYQRVNNAGAALARGEVLVFLNDDTKATDPGWLHELVGWARRPEIGTVGPRLIGPDDEIQHMGVWLGPGGFADHIFQGMRPGEDSIFGSTNSYRNTLAVTGACVAIRRDLYDQIGGFDERFQLTGGDVALGLDCVLRGFRNVCTPHTAVRHLESVTRGSIIPTGDFFASYWKYNTWLFGGDPYFNANLSLGSRRPALRHPREQSVRQRISVPLGRSFEAFRQTSDANESRMLAIMCNADRADVDEVLELHARNAGLIDVKTVNWFIPDIDSPFYGGINTAFRIADYLARHHGVTNRMITLGTGVEFLQSALAAAFPALSNCEIIPVGGHFEQASDLPPADAAIATLWVTAYALMHAKNQKRKFYLVQDFEPMFYPAGTNYALTEESYRLGLYGICNTHNLKDIYVNEYGGKGMSFMPAVDTSIFHARTRPQRKESDPVTIFVYARPGHWRNCWEMAAPALEKVKATLGDRVRIVTAGAWATGAGADHDIKPLGLMPYAKTGDQYRDSDIGLALTVSKHPSYLPLELMACGAPVVAFDNPWGHWILKDGQNSLLCMRTIDDMAEQLIKMAEDHELRERLQRQALADIEAGHSDWESALSGIYGYLCDPEGTSAGAPSTTEA